MTNHSGIRDSGEIYQIIPTTRKIVVPAGHRTLAAVGDHNSEQVTFKCPKMIDGHDIENCTKHWVVWRNADGKTGRDIITDITTDDENVYLKWTITGSLTNAKGDVGFAVLFEDIVAGVAVYSWSTATCTECSIVDTITHGSESGSTANKLMIIGSNGLHTVRGYDFVNVNVPVNKAAELETLEAKKNDVYYPSEGKDGFSKVTVLVEPKLQEKTATGNGEVYADSDYDGLSKVTVDIPEGAPTLQTKNIEVKSGNSAETVTVTADEGNDGLQQVNVTVKPINLQPAKYVTPSETQQKVDVVYGYDGLGQVIVEAIPSSYVQPSGTENIYANVEKLDVSSRKYVSVKVPSGAKEEETREVEAYFVGGNMEILPQNSKNAMSKVIVVMPAYLKPENIRKGIVIAGITGTFEGYNASTLDIAYLGALGKADYNVTAEDIRSLTQIGDGLEINVNYKSSGGFLYICIPANKAITSIVEQGNDLLRNGDIIKTNETRQVNGQEYVIYRTKSGQVATTYNLTITLRKI